MRTSTNLALKLLVGAFTGAVLLTFPAISAPIAAPISIPATSVDNNQFVQVRAVRGGHRGGSVHRSGVAVRRGAAVYRGGAVVRRGAIAGSGYYGSYCDPNYQNCGGGAYYAGGVYRGGAVVRGGAAVARGGAVARGRAAYRGGARVSRAGGRRR